MNARSIYRQVLTHFRERPYLRVTVGQAAQLWALDRQQCATVLRALATAGHLRAWRDGSYSLITPGRTLRTRFVRRPFDAEEAAA